MESADQSATHPSLLLRVRDLSDAVAWRDFVESYAPRIFGWCQQMGLQEADAADATQTVLLKLVNSLRQFEYDRNRGSFRGWLKTVSQRVATDILRGWRDRGVGGTEVRQPWVEVADKTAIESFDQALEGGYRQEILRLAEHRVRLKIKPTTWDAYRLVITGNQTPLAAAKQLNVAIGEIYVAKSRVLKMLRVEIQTLDPSLLSTDAGQEGAK